MSTDGIQLPPEFDDLDIGITLHGPETGAILDVNSQLEELYGYSRDQLQTMTVDDYTAPSTKYTQETAVERIRAAADGETQVFEWQIERSNRERRWVRVHLNDTAIDGTACVIAEIEEITEYKAREQRLQLLNRIVRHNLRNDMNVIIGNADLLQQAVENETLADAADTVIETANAVGTLTESIAQLERIAEPGSTERSPTDLRAVAESVVEEARQTYPEADLTLDAPDPVWAVGDAGVQHALEHAVENAIEHNDGQTVSVTVTVADDTENGLGTVTVADDGPTIPDMEIDALAADTETSSTYHGSGVGLWVMQWCVDSLGGDLTFEENDPQGNVVRIKLPKPDSDEALG